MQVKERFRPQVMAADSSYIIGGETIGGFLCTVSGTLTISDADGNAIVDTLPVTAGIYVPIPLDLGGATNTVALAGGAAGTLFV